MTKPTPEELAEKARRRAIREDGIRHTLPLFSKPCQTNPPHSSPASIPKIKTGSSEWRSTPPQP